MKQNGESLNSEISEPEKTEAALRENEERYRSILDHIGHGYFEVDLKGNFTFFNEILCKTLLYSPDEMMGSNYSQYVDQKATELLAHIFNQVYETGKPSAIEFDMVRKDGAMLPVELIVALFKDKDDRPIGFRGVTQDITLRKQASEKLKRTMETLRSEIQERKKIEQALRESEQRYRTVLETIEDTFYEVDLLGNLVFFNDPFCKLLGYSHDELMNMNFRQYMPPEAADRIFALFNKAYKTGKPKVGFDYKTIRKDGSTREMEASVALKRDSDGNPVGFMGILRDITKRKQAEEEMRRAKEAAEIASQSKSEFLANMSHEIRTPMNAVIGLTDLVLRTELTAKQRDYLGKLRISSSTLLDIINDILDFSKIEVGKLNLELVDFNLRDVLTNIADMISGNAAEKGIEFNISLASDVPLLLRGDPLRLGQILINLTNNAVKFTDKGEVVIQVEVMSKDQHQVRLQFSVTDTGIGITQEEIDKLFDSFTQADGSTTRKYGGTGLGLTISKRLVEMMNGTIWAERNPQQGSTFIFEIDFECQLTGPEFQLDIPEGLHGMHVLVVDDNKTAQKILVEILKSFNFSSVTTASGAAALQELKAAHENQRPYDLVLMDWKMPGLNGIETSLEIRRHPQWGTIPMIIMITAFGREEVMQHAHEAGVNAFLMKPVNPSLLWNTILEVFGKKSPSLSPEKKTKIRELESIQKIRDSRILLVEDNTINQQVAMEILHSAGAIVDLAVNGLEAVEVLAHNRYDAVLMDIQMPIMDGHEATRIIRNNPQNHELPIIAMTAHAMKGDREKCIESGMNDYVTKPIRTEEFLAALAKWIKVTHLPVPRPVRLAETVADTQNVVLPASMTGIDIDSALNRLGGNKKLYKKLLLEFAQEYAQVTHEIQAALKRGNLEDAHHITHTIKGVSGNISALELHTAADALDTSIKDRKTTEYEVKLNVFDQALKQVMETIKNLDQDRDSQPDYDRAPMTVEIIKMKSLLVELQGFIKRKNPKAEDCFQAVKSLLPRATYGEMVLQLGDHLDRFDFINAQKSLFILANKLGITLLEK